MTIMDTLTFLDALKPGDKVAIRTRDVGGLSKHEKGYIGWNVESISAKRTKIVVTRQKKVDGKVVGTESMVFNARGENVEGTSWSRHVYKLEPITEEIMNSIMHDSCVIKSRKALGHALEHLETAQHMFKEVRALSEADLKLLSDAAYTIVGVLASNKIEPKR